MTEIERRLKQAEENEKARQSTGKGTTSTQTGRSAASSSSGRSDTERRLRIAEEQNRRYSAPAANRRAALQRKTESFMEATTEAEPEARAAIDRYKAAEDAKYYAAMNQRGATIGDDAMLERGRSGYERSSDQWRASYDKGPQASQPVAAETPERAARNRNYWAEAAKQAAQFGDQARYGKAMENVAAADRDARNASALRQKEYERQLEALRQSNPAEYYALTKSDDEIDKLIAYYDYGNRNEAGRAAYVNRTPEEEAEYLNNLRRARFAGESDAERAAYIRAEQERYENAAKSYENRRTVMDNVAGRTMRNVTNDPNWNAYFERTPEEEAEYLNNLRRARFAGESDAERAAYIQGEKDRYAEQFRNYQNGPEYSDRMEGARIEAGIQIEALERAKAIHELERANKSPASIEAGRKALREQQDQLLAENGYKNTKTVRSYGSHRQVKEREIRIDNTPTDSVGIQEMMDKGWVLSSSFYALPEELRNNVYAVAAKDTGKAVELAQYYLKLAEDEAYQKIYDWVNKDSGWQFGRRAVGMVGGAALKLASGLDPYGAVGQGMSKTGNALTSGGAASAARNGLFGIEALGGDESGISSDVPFIGRGQAGITYQVGASVLQSAAIAAPAMLLGNYSEAAAKVAEVLGTTLMGSSAAADDYTQCIQNGMTVDQARMHATAAGIAEAAFEYISLDKLVDPDLTTSALKRWLQQAGIEASEEVVTSIANRISDELLADIHGIESAVERRTRELMAEGLAYNAARGKAENEWLAEITQDGMSGFLSGLIMGGGSEIMRGVETFRLNRANRNTQTPTTLLQQEAATDSAELPGGTEQATVGVGSVQQNAAKAQNQQSTEMEQGRSDAQYMEPDELDSAIEYWSGLLESARGENNQEIVNRYAEYVAGLKQVQQERADLNQRRLEAGDDLGLAEGLGRVGVEQVNQRQAVTGSQADYGGQRMPATAEQNGGMNHERIQGGSQIGGDSRQIARAADDGQLAARAAGPADSGQRDAGLGTDRQAGGLGEGTGRSVAGGAAAQELYQLRNQVRALEAERRSAAQIGVAYGTKNESLRVVPEELYTSAMRAEQARAEENGVRLTYVTGGAIEIRGKGGRILKADGLHQVDADGASHIFARADSKRFTPEQLTRHEDFHDMVANNRGLLLDMVEALYETQGEEGVARLVDAYVTALDGCYGVYTEGMTEDDQRALAMLYLEEIFADQYASMNRSSGEARRAAELAGGVAQRFAGDIENARQNRAGIDRRNGPGTRLTYAGQNAETADVATLDEARQRIADGEDSETVRKETGWFRGMDGKWRFEIDDSSMEYRRQGDMQSMRDPEYREYLELWDKVVARLEGTEEEMERLRELDKRFSGVGRVAAYKLNNGSATLQDIIQHDALFEAYPMLKDVHVQFADLKPGVNASYDQKNNTIRISYELQGKPEETLIHEIQHAIQEIEGFAKGANAGYWAGRIQEDRAREISEAEEEVRRLFDALPDEVKDRVRAYNRASLNRDYDHAQQVEDQLYADGYGDMFSEYMDAVTFLDLERRRQQNNPISEDSADLYFRTAGEVEARDAASRRELPSEQRKDTRPDIDRKDVVFARPGTKSFDMANAPQKRSYIPYKDRAASDKIEKETAMSLIAKGKFTEISLADYSDLKKGVDWSDDKKDGKEAVKDILKPFIGQDLYFRDGSSTVVAYLTRKGVNHSGAGGRSLIKGALYSKFLELVSKAEYAYSTQHDPHAKQNPNLTPIAWDSYVATAYVEVKQEDGTITKERYDVVFKLESVAEDVRSRLNAMWTKKEAAVSHDIDTSEESDSALPNYEATTTSVSNIAEYDSDVKTEDQGIDWNGNWEEPEARLSAADADDDSLGVDWIGSREEGETKTQAVTATDAPHPSPAATHSPEGEGSETGGQAARVTENAQAMAREKKVSIAEKASIEGLKSRIESAEKRLGAYQILQQEGMMTDEIRAQMRDVQESLEIFRNALDDKKAKRKAAKEAEKNNKELRAQRKQARAAEKKALAKEAELQADKPRQARKEFRQDALNLFSVPAAKRQTLGNLLNRFADTVTEKGSVSEADRRDLFRQLYEAGVEVAQPEDYYRDIRDFVKSGRVYVPEDVRAEFGDDWDAFRKRAWGNGIYLTNDQNDRGADAWNAELAEVFPGSFDASETDARNMLENIVDLAEEGKAEFVSIEEMMRRNQDQYGVTVDQQMDELEQKVDHLMDTFDQKAELEQKVKKAGVMQLVKERQKNREIAAQQTQRKRENETRSQVMKQLQQLNKMRKKSAPEIQKQIDSIIGNLDTMARSISPAGLEDLQALSRKYMEAAEDPNFLGNPYVEARLARLNQVQLDDLEISDVIELGRTISALVKTVTDDKKLLTDARNKEVSEAASMAAKEIQSSEGSKGGKLRDFLGNEHLSPTREIQRLGGWVRGGQMEQLSRSLEDGGTRRMDYQRQATRIFDKFLADKANQKWLQTAQGKDAQWIKLTVPAGITGKDGALKIENVSFEITPMMRVGLLMHSRNVDNLRHIETGGIVIPNKEYYRKGDLANADAKGTRVKLRPETVRAIVRECTAQERAFAGLLEQYYDGLSKEKINEVSMQIDGFERAGGDHYYGIKVSRKFLAAQPEQIQRNLALDSIGSIVNERVHAGTPIILEDASKALEDHIDLISKYYGYTAAIRDFNAVMNYTFHESAKDGGTANAYAGSVKEILQDKWGSGAQKYLDKLLGDLQQSSGINETAAQFLAKLRGNLAGASLMFNPAVAVSQTASLPGAMQTLGLDGIVAALKPEKVDMGLIEKYSPVLWYRNQGNSTQELGDYMKEQGLEGKLPFFFNWIQKMDSWTIRRIWTGAEYRVSKDTDLSPGSKAEIDAGTDPYYQEVARVFQRAVYDTQPNYSEMQRPEILRSESDLTKMLTMYKTVPLQYYNMMYEAVGRLRADKARLKQDASAENKANYEQSKSFAAKTFVGVLSANVVYVVMKALIKGTIGGKKKKYLDDEGDLDAGKIFGGLGKDLIETYAGSIIGGSDLLTSAEKLFDAATTGSYSRYGGTEISALSAIEDTLGGLYNLAKEIHDQDLTGGLGAVKELAKQLSMDTGIPANNIETYLLGTMKWIAPEWVDRYENFFDEFERADLKGEHGRDLRAAIRVLMDNRTDGLKDETIDEIMRLWENGQNAAIPSAIPSKVSIEGEDVEIKGADRSAFRERWGQVIGESLEKLLASDAYEAADDKGKAKLIAKLYEYARQQAAAAVTERKLDAWVEFGKACEAAGIPLTDYLTVASVDKGKLKDMDGEALDSAIRSRMEFRVGDLDEKTLDELGRLFANGASGAIPSDVPTSVSVSGEERNLTPEERVAWLHAWKRIAGEGLEGLISSGAYKTADDAGKAKMLSALYDMARASASSEVVNGYAPDKWVSVGMEAAERGVPIDEYAAFHVGMSGLKTAEKLALIKGQSWSDNQKEFIWTELMATDTQYAKYQNLKNAGMKWADAMEQLGIGAASTTPSGLTDAQQAQYDKYWNEISGPATQQLLQNADYKKADKAGQAAFLDRLNDYAARVAKAKVLSGYDKGKWVECGERLVSAGVSLDDYIVYYEGTSDANNRAKYEALAKTGWTEKQKLIAMENISESVYNTGKIGRDYQVPLTEFLGGLANADADQSGNINQDEAEAWLDRTSLGWEDKAYLWQMLCYSSKWKNNPYSAKLGEEIWHSLHPDK